MNEIQLPSGYKDCTCGGTGLSTVTAEPIALSPGFRPQPLPCSDCSRRAAGVPPTRPEGSLSPSPYSIWHPGRR